MRGGAKWWRISSSELWSAFSSEAPLRCPMLTRAYAHTLEHLDLGVGAGLEEVIGELAVGDDGVHV